MHLAPDEKPIYWAGFVVRCALGLAAWWVSQFFAVDLIGDAMLYERIGARIALEWYESGTSETLATLISEGRHAWVMFFVMGALSYLLGGARALPLLVLLFNLVTAWVPVIVYRIARELGISADSARYAIYLVMFSPVFAFWAGALYKEGLVQLVLALVVLHGLKLQRAFYVRSLVILVACLFALLGLRFYMTVLIAPAVAVALLLGANRSRRGASPHRDIVVRMVRQCATVVTVITVLATMGFHQKLGSMLPQDTRDTFSQLQWSRDDLAQTNSGYLWGADVSTPSRAARFLPVGIVYFLTVPFPWELGSLRQNLVIPEMIFWLCLYPVLFLGMRTGLRSNFKGSALLLTVTLGMIVFYGLFVGNAGTAYRLRAQVWLLWAVFLGWYRDAKTRPTQSLTGRSHGGVTQVAGPRGTRTRDGCARSYRTSGSTTARSP